MTSQLQWRPCSACKQPIGFGAKHWVCNVSTCNRKRTGLVFCSVTCWEVHLPSANHREAWALDRMAPATREEAESAAAPGRRRRSVSAPQPRGAGPPREVLIVASRLKDYVRSRSGGFNTSDTVLVPLSDIVRRVCEEAIRNARSEGRMTVLDRDIPTG